MLIGRLLSSSRKRELRSRSGAMSTSLYSPFASSPSRCDVSAGDSVELINVAAMPRLRMPSTWSFISAMSGEKTTAVPGSISAANW